MKKEEIKKIEKIFLEDFILAFLICNFAFNLLFCALAFFSNPAIFKALFSILVISLVSALVLTLYFLLYRIITR